MEQKIPKKRKQILPPKQIWMASLMSFLFFLVDLRAQEDPKMLDAQDIPNETGQEARDWMQPSTGIKVKGTFREVTHDGTIVRIIKEDGLERSLPIATLRQSDRAYINAQFLPPEQKKLWEYSERKKQEEWKLADGGTIRGMVIGMKNRIVDFFIPEQTKFVSVTPARLLSLPLGEIDRTEWPRVKTSVEREAEEREKHRSRLRDASEEVFGHSEVGYFIWRTGVLWENGGEDETVEFPVHFLARQNAEPDDFILYIKIGSFYHTGDKTILPDSLIVQSGSFGDQQFTRRHFYNLKTKKREASETIVGRGFNSLNRPDTKSRKLKGYPGVKSGQIPVSFDTSSGGLFSKFCGEMELEIYLIDAKDSATFYAEPISNVLRVPVLF